MELEEIGWNEDEIWSVNDHHTWEGSKKVFRESMKQWKSEKSPFFSKSLTRSLRIFLYNSCINIGLFGWGTIFDKFKIHNSLFERSNRHKIQFPFENLIFYFFFHHRLRFGVKTRWKFHTILVMSQISRLIWKMSCAPPKNESETLFYYVKCWRCF